MKRKRDSKKQLIKTRKRKRDSKKKSGTVVVWEEGDREGYGRRYSTYTEEPVAKPKLAIQAAILFHCRMLVHNPEKWFKGEVLKYSGQGYGGLGMAEPPFRWTSLGNIREEITNTVAKELEKVCDSDLKDPKISDFVFLATLGKKRNWRRDCCICLSDKMMGTICGCGHFEIAIFRPCGHAVCVNPCFEKMMKHQGLKLETKKYTTKAGKVFLLPSQKDITSAKNFLCPLCRQDVKSVFRAENTFFSGKHPKFNLSQLTERCWYSSYYPRAFSSSPKE